MFNSKKKKAAAEAEQAQRVQSAALQAQFDEVRTQRAALDERIATLDQANAHLDSRLAALDQGVGAISEELVKLNTASATTNQRLRAIDERVTGADEHLRSIDERVNAADVRVDAISHRLGDVEILTADLDEINQRLASFGSPPDPADAPPPPPDSRPLTAAPPRTATAPPPPCRGSRRPPPVADDDLNERVAELRAQLDALAEETASIDARVTGVSMELANQLTELGRDIDELNRRATESAGADDIDTAELEARIAERLDTALEDVLDSTERLAAEQARYEIQFRADLAELAERIRRPGS